MAIYAVQFLDNVLVLFEIPLRESHFLSLLFNQ